MRKFSDCITDFLRQQDIVHLNSKPVLADWEHEQLRQFLTEEVAEIQFINLGLRKEVQRLRQLVVRASN